MVGIINTSILHRRKLRGRVVKKIVKATQVGGRKTGNNPAVWLESTLRIILSPLFALGDNRSAHFSSPPAYLTRELVITYLREHEPTHLNPRAFLERIQSTNGLAFTEHLGL